MFRLGIIGSDNSHAERFSELANLEEGINGRRIEDVRVTHIYGTDPVRTKEVAEKGRIPNIVTRSEDMLGSVDGVLCVWRHGSKHLHDTLPFLKAKIPAFVDKPLASSVADATELIQTAEQAGVGFTSFSTLRYARSTLDWIASLPGTAGEFVSGMSTGHADLSSEYDGVFFYGIHAVELMVATFGYGCRSVTAVAQGNDCMAVCRYGAGPMITLNLPSKASYVFHLTAYGTKGWSQYAVDSSTAYFDGMSVFMECLRTGTWPLTREQLLEPIKILAAINKSLAEKREVTLDEV